MATGGFDTSVTNYARWALFRRCAAACVCKLSGWLVPLALGRVCIDVGS